MTNSMLSRSLTGTKRLVIVKFAKSLKTIIYMYTVTRNLVLLTRILLIGISWRFCHLFDNYLMRILLQV